jgi:hypothetical protein
MVMQSAPGATVGATVALFLPTIVSGEETAMFVEAAVSIPLISTTGTEFFLARPTPARRLHTGAWGVPALLSLQVAVPSAPT